MRYRELITEGATELATILNLTRTIKQNCQPYLQQNSGAVNRYALYRGVRSTKGAPNGIRKEVRLTDRKPKDMPHSLHQFINGYFKKNYGAAFRSAIFATGSSGSAGEYGEMYIIFPAGEFQYLWSPDYEDLYSITSEYGFDQIAPSSMSNEEKVEWQENAKEALQDEVLSSYQTDKLEAAIDSSHEIMIRCSHYYGIHADVMYNKEYREAINDELYK